MQSKIKVLVVDDSAAVREILLKILNSDPEIEVMGTAANPYFSVQQMKKQKPDVITLDVEMPQMDGITFLGHLMRQHPMPVVIISSLALEGAETTLRALELGAVEIIAKPALGASKFLEESREQICGAVKNAAKVNAKSVAQKIKTQPRLDAGVVIPRKKNKAMAQTTEKVLVAGASTGGTQALEFLLRSMPQDAPGIVIVQHMPEHYTRAFAQRLNGVCRIQVKEGRDNDTVIRGQAIIAPGNKHTLVKRSGARYYIEVRDGELVSRHRPSVDVLFRSTAQYAGGNALGVILTGMGNDGARGMMEMKEAGAYTIAQDKQSCVVFGMPQEAIRLGGVEKVLPLEKIPAMILRVCN